MVLPEVGDGENAGRPPLAHVGENAGRTAGAITNRCGRGASSSLTPAATAPRDSTGADFLEDFPRRGTEGEVASWCGAIGIAGASGTGAEKPLSVPVCCGPGSQGRNGS